MKRPAAKAKEAAVLVAKKSSGSNDTLEYKKNIKTNSPRYFKNLKVYVDPGRKMWRIHQQHVRVDLFKVSFKTATNKSELEDAWSSVVKHVHAKAK